MILELSECDIPHSLINSLEVLSVIPTEPAPGMLHPDNFSINFNRFVKKCLTKVLFCIFYYSS
jgi:hypothetical protein